ncbi:hypothetical protein OG216_36940 [Streptomycetaceae bacterium NBC_01309]
MDHAQATAPEPHDPRDDGRHLLTVMAGVMVVLIAIAVVLAGDWWNEEDPGRPGGSRIDTRTLTWDPQDHGSGFTVAASWREYVATRTDDDSRAAAMTAPPTDFTRNVVVTASVSTKCVQATAMRLYADGNELGVDVDMPGGDTDNCDGYNFAAADFEVPRDLLPAAPVLDGNAPRSAGVGILRTTALVTAPPDLGVVAAEVPDELAARSWLAGLGGLPGTQGVSAPKDLAAAYRNPEAATFDLSRERTFAFLYPVCASYAAQLRHGSDGRLEVVKAEAPKPRSGAMPAATESCAPTAYRLALFSLAPDEVPATPPVLHIFVAG